MDGQRAYGVREIANWILDYADRKGISLTNMSLNKLAYFAYERALVEHGRRLFIASRPIGRRHPRIDGAVSALASSAFFPPSARKSFSYTRLFGSSCPTHVVSNGFMARPPRRTS